MGLIPGLGRPLEKEMATHSSTLAWKISWMEGSGRLQSIVLQESDMTEQLHWFTGPVFQASFIEESTPLYILASFVKDKVPIGVWVYL